MKIGTEVIHPDKSGRFNPSCRGTIDSVVIRHEGRLYRVNDRWFEAKYLQAI